MSQAIVTVTPTFADIFRPSAHRQVKMYSFLLIAAGSLLIALGAQIAIRSPFSPVPVTGQTLGVLLAGTLLGSRRGVAAIGLYLLEGAAGLPVFANGAAGFSYLLGPTGGYLIGFVGAAYITGILAERGWDRRLHTAVLAMLLGNGTIYLFGMSWLAVFTGFGGLLQMGLLPFIPGDLLKILLVAALMPAGWKLVRPGTPH